MKMKNVNLGHVQDNHEADTIASLILFAVVIPEPPTFETIWHDSPGYVYSTMTSSDAVTIAQSSRHAAWTVRTCWFKTMTSPQVQVSNPVIAHSYPHSHSQSSQYPLCVAAAQSYSRPDSYALTASIMMMVPAVCRCCCVTLRPASAHNRATSWFQTQPLPRAATVSAVTSWVKVGVA